MNRALYILLVIVTLIFTNCTKGPGEGGNASIVGTVTKEFRITVVNPATYQYSAAALDQSVYIIYGDHISPDDNVDTNHLGEFEFRNLRKGEYTVYVYSADTTGLNTFESNRMPIIRTFEISDRNEEVDLGEIIIYDKP